MERRTSLNALFAWAIAGAAALTALIAVTAPALSRFYPLLPDKGPSWYFWQLPEPRAAARASAWILYALHQASLWYLAYRFRKEADHPDRASRLNAAALALNGLFVLLHIAQTQLFYDGLAQDVPVWTSQGSVIVMLVIMLYTLSPRRGLILGLKPPFRARALAWVRSWHGFYISWAICYTFWFHPTEGDYGLLTGFFYMFLLFIQFSFARTRLHVAIGWLTVLETAVALHGPAIAIQKARSGNEGDVTGPGIWIMFATGFLFMLAFTGQYGFKLKPLARAAVFASYAALVAGLFAWRGFDRIFEITFIPVALYGGAIAMALVAGLWARIFPGRADTLIRPGESL
ncbi:MAG: hypothetical protein KKA67_07920 [Spirochaetes bacterium]|nr:hypothetical protein [Spirochaetota bacterium]MBU1079185.1 hypothetical protein [Spirochaetota bacterium]